MLADGTVLRGVILPSTEFSRGVVIKLENGYNVGIDPGRIVEVEPIGRAQLPPQEPPQEELEVDTGRPWVSVVVTGGTILSRVEYRTGAVYPTLNPRHLLELAPELGEVASIRVVPLMAKFSEDFTPGDWARIAEAVAREFERGARGVLVLHGTDTMHYTAAALSFAISSAPGPTILVGAQRSSDRPSSDAFENLLGAAIAATSLDTSEAMLAMHASTSDGVVAVHRGTRVRKMHTSRRDTFRSIGVPPLALVDVRARTVELVMEPCRGTGPVRLDARFSDRVALVKFFPGAPPSILEHLVEEGYRGLVIEGTGFGHVSEAWLHAIRRIVDEGVHVVMTSQTLHGRVNLLVYRRGRELLEAGVIPGGDMLPETAYVKLSWLLGTGRDPRTEMLRPICGEVSSREPPDAFSETVKTR